MLESIKRCFRCTQNGMVIDSSRACTCQIYYTWKNRGWREWRGRSHLFINDADYFYLLIFSLYLRYSHPVHPNFPSLFVFIIRIYNFVISISPPRSTTRWRWFTLISHPVRWGQLPSTAISWILQAFSRIYLHKRTLSEVCDCAVNEAISVINGGTISSQRRTEREPNLIAYKV